MGTPFNEAPLQTTELLNVGEAELSYLVDTAKIADANARQGHGVPVISRLASRCPSEEADEYRGWFLKRSGAMRYDAM